MYDQVAIFSLNPTWPLTSIHFEGEELVPYTMLPNDGGVEFRSGYAYEYRAVTEEDHLAHANLVSRIDHCRKLLDDLPIALKNSESAQLVHAKSEELDLNTLGAMVIEQNRIQKEITDQRAKLSQLEREEQLSIQRIESTRKLFRLQTVAKVPFGEVHTADRTYRLKKVAPQAHADEGVPMEAGTIVPHAN